MSAEIPEASIADYTDSQADSGPAVEDAIDNSVQRSLIDGVVHVRRLRIDDYNGHRTLSSGFTDTRARAAGSNIFRNGTPSP
jgi:hypothetical protein